MSLHEEFKVFIDVDKEEAEYVEVDDEMMEDAEQDNSLQLKRSESIRQKREDLVFEIIPSAIEQVKEKCIKNKFPLIEEYDFKSDTKSPDLKIEIHPQT